MVEYLEAHILQKVLVMLVLVYHLFAEQDFCIIIFGALVVFFSSLLEKYYVNPWHKKFYPRDKIFYGEVCLQICKSTMKNKNVGVA